MASGAWRAGSTAADQPGRMASRQHSCRPARTHGEQVPKEPTSPGSTAADQPRAIGVYRGCLMKLKTMKLHAVNHGWFDLRPSIDCDAFRNGIFLSSADCGSAGKSGSAGRRDRETLLRSFHGCVQPGSGQGGRPVQSTPVLCTKQVHSLRIVKVEKLTAGGCAVSILEAGWDGTRYHSYPLADRVFMEAGAVVEMLPHLEADGILCNDQALGLAVTVADCMPIFVAWGGWRALLHSGWAGTGILRRLLEDEAFMPGDRRGGQQEDIELVFGPCISVERYEVAPERAELFAARFGQEAVQGCCLDIRRANLSLLKNRDDLRVHVWQDCTASDPALFSFRRQGAKDYGLMLALFPPAL